MTDKPTARVRLTLELSERLSRVLDRLAEQRGVSKADVLRNALEILVAAEKAHRDGLTVGAWKSDEKGLPVLQREFVSAISDLRLDAP